MKDSAAQDSGAQTAVLAGPEGRAGLIGRLSTSLLCLLLLGDLMFIVVHLAAHHVPASVTTLFQDPGMQLTEDRSHAEFYQYVKEAWIVALAAYCGCFLRRFSLWSIAALFFYLLLDDSLRVHEALGYASVSVFGFSDMFGMRAVDFGEIFASGAIGSALLALLAWRYLRESGEFRRIVRHTLVFLIWLVAFGIGVDMLHVIAHGHEFLQFLLGLLEDAGEMVVMSFIAAYWFGMLESARATGRLP